MVKRYPIHINISDLKLWEVEDLHVDGHIDIEGFKVRGDSVYAYIGTTTIEGILG